MDVKLNPQSAKLLADIRGYLALNEQQRKVIEAAKAYCAGVNGLPGSEEPEDVWVRLDAAVEALQEARDE